MESKTKRVGPAKDKHSPIREQLVKSTRDVVDTWHAENKTFGSEYVLGGAFVILSC